MKWSYNLFLLITFNLIVTPVFSQINHRESMYYNIGTSGVLGGLGAIINKKPDMPLGKTFVKGFAKGMVGGFFIYESKNVSSLITKHDKLEYNWLAKTVNCLGTSMVENAATNRKLLAQLNFNIGFNRFEIYTAEKFKVKYKILPVSLLLTSYVALNHKFEIKKSFSTGEFIFSSNKLASTWGSSAYTLGTAVAIDEKSLNTNFIINHELIHVYQFYDFNPINTYLQKIDSKLEQNSSFFKFYNKYFYNDMLSTITQTSLYYIKGNSDLAYRKNFFENEARLFTE
ncbi:hypothetical protein [Flavobacterium sp.]|uniref:hypothetical protein n=1 Tax=Flavobacterium sp. TaxID=239 RepID=UPI0037527529